MTATCRPLACVAAATLFVASATVATAQDVAPPATTPDATARPITPSERVGWVATSVVGPQSLMAGAVLAGTETMIPFPSEWKRSAAGFGRRYAARDGAIAMSNGIEASLGALWGEDPRYFECRCDGLGRRTAHAAKFSVLAARSDGHLAPAWGRYVGTVNSNFVQNAWLPPSARTWQQMVLRQAGGVGGRFIGNLWAEFWPDVRRRFTHGSGRLKPAPRS
jgi:hypothetical protein